MSSIYRKGRDGYFYYQTYLKNPETGKNKTNIDFEINCNSYFEKEVGKYCYMWKTGGEYSK